MKELSISKLQVGDIIAISSDSWLAKRIQGFMRKQARKKYGVKLDRYYNHTMIVTDVAPLRIQHAIGKGAVRQDLFKKYSRNDVEKMCVFRYWETLTKKQKTALKDKASEIRDKNVEYELLNFMWWAVYIWSNGKVDWSPKGEKAYKKVFCFELSIIILNAAVTATKQLFRKPSHITTVDLEEDGRFEQYQLTL